MGKPNNLQLLVLLAVLVGGLAFEVARPRPPLFHIRVTRQAVEQGKPVVFFCDVESAESETQSLTLCSRARTDRGLFPRHIKRAAK